MKINNFEKKFERNGVELLNKNSILTSRQKNYFGNKFESFQS